MFYKFIKKTLGRKHTYFICVFIVVVCFCTYIYTTRKVREPLTNSVKNAFCLITTKPDDIWIEFVNTFTNLYDVYIVVDDNTFDTGKYRENYPSIHFLLFKEEESKANGYWDASYLIKKEVIAWDKALYYFARVNTTYKNVWLCEDDVFIHSVNIIHNIDTRYPETDLLCVNKMKNTTGETNSWMHWVKAQEMFDLPWSGSLISFCRVSSRLFASIDEFVKKNEKLTFLEVLFPTVADKNGFTIEHPIELSGIDHAPKTVEAVVDNGTVYHAVKNIKAHLMLRSK